MLKFNSTVLEENEAMLNEISSKLSGISGNLLYVRTHLGMNLSGSSGVQNKLKKYSSNLQSLSEATSSLSSLLAQANILYQSVDVKAQNADNLDAVFENVSTESVVTASSAYSETQEMTESTSNETSSTYTGGLTSSEATSKENADKAGLTYYSNKYDYDDAWYQIWWLANDGGTNGESGCALTCMAMVLSYFGYTDGRYYPGALKEKNGGGAYVTSWKNLASGTDVNVSTGSSQSYLDEQLDEYINDPENNAPPILSFTTTWNTKKDCWNTHFVIVVGKDESGNYIIVDPSDNTKTTLNIGSTFNDDGSSYTIRGVRSVVGCSMN